MDCVRAEYLGGGRELEHQLFGQLDDFLVVHDLVAFEHAHDAALDRLGAVRLDRVLRGGLVLELGLAQGEALGLGLEGRVDSEQGRARKRRVGLGAFGHEQARRSELGEPRVPETRRLARVRRRRAL